MLECLSTEERLRLHHRAKELSLSWGFGWVQDVGYKTKTRVHRARNNHEWFPGLPDSWEILTEQRTQQTIDKIGYIIGAHYRTT
jgi:hypothetical protein